MSAAPPNPVSFPPSHQSAAGAGVRHHQPHHHFHHSTQSTCTPSAASSSGALDVSSSAQGIQATSSSSYHTSSYATAPSLTPTPTQQSQSYLSTPTTSSTAAAAANIHQSTSSASLAHMARLQSHFSQLAPSCSAHLADQNAIPILSTTPHPSSPGLSSLSAAFVQAHDTASRLGLGVPLRVTVTTGQGAAVIQSGVLPEGEQEEEQEEGMGNGVHRVGGAMGGGGEGVMLVGTVIAPGDRLAEARIASWGVEEVARKFQRFMCEGK